MFWRWEMDYYMKTIQFQQQQGFFQSEWPIYSLDCSCVQGNCLMPQNVWKTGNLIQCVYGRVKPWVVDVGGVEMSVTDLFLYWLFDRLIISIQRYFLLSSRLTANMSHGAKVEHSEWLCMKWHGALLYGVHRTSTETAAVSCGTSHASAVSTPLLWIFKKTLSKLVTHVEPHASTVSLLKRAENSTI